MNGKIFLSWTFFLLYPLAKRKNIFSLMFYIKTKAKQQGMTEIRGLWPGDFWARSRQGSDACDRR